MLKAAVYAATWSRSEEDTHVCTTVKSLASHRSFDRASSPTETTFLRGRLSKPSRARADWDDASAPSF